MTPPTERTPEPPPCQHNVNPATDRCVLCGRNAFQREAAERTPERAQDEKPRIWALHCPFTKSGFPNVGNFGSTVRPVVVIPMATWTKLCEEIPELAAKQFEVGTTE